MPATNFHSDTYHPNLCHPYSPSALHDKKRDIYFHDNQTFHRGSYDQLLLFSNIIPLLLL